MTTITPFSPSAATPFQFNPTLDGQVYSAIITWNLFGQRWYANLYALDGVRVFTLPLIGSAVGINLQTLSWALGTVTAVTSIPHGYKVGATIRLTITGVVPDGYNGTFDCLITGDSQFTYQMPTALAGMTQAGVVSYDISLTAGYFASTMVFREPNQQFEVSP